MHDAEIATRTADWLGVQIIKQVVGEEELAENFVNAAYHFEHPALDLNGIGKYVLSTAPREHGVKVVLTGEGSDEHFAGYPFFPAEHLREPDLAFSGSSLVTDPLLLGDLQTRSAADLKAMGNAGGFADLRWDPTPSLAMVNNSLLASSMPLSGNLLATSLPGSRARGKGLTAVIRL